MNSSSYYGAIAVPPGATDAQVPQRQEIDKEFTKKSGLRIMEGANSKQGAVNLVGGAAVVANTSVTASSRIFLTSQVDGGTPGFLRVSARIHGISFTITSSSTIDTSTVAFEIFEVEP